MTQQHRSSSPPLSSPRMPSSSSSSSHTAPDTTSSSSTNINTNTTTTLSQQQQHQNHQNNTTSHRSTMPSSLLSHGGFANDSPFDSGHQQQHDTNNNTRNPQQQQPPDTPLSPASISLFSLSQLKFIDAQILYRHLMDDAAMRMHRSQSLDKYQTTTGGEKYASSAAAPARGVTLQQQQQQQGASSRMHQFSTSSSSNDSSTTNLQLSSSNATTTDSTSDASSNSSTTSIPSHLLILSAKWKNTTRITNLSDLKPQTVYFIFDLRKKIAALHDLPPLDLNAFHREYHQEQYPPGESTTTTTTAHDTSSTSTETYNKQLIEHIHSTSQERKIRTHTERFCISAATALHQYISNWKLLLKNALQLSLEHQDEIMRISHSSVVQNLKDVELPQRRRHTPSSVSSSISPSDSTHDLSRTAESGSSENSTFTPGNDDSLLLSSSTSADDQLPPPRTLYDVLPDRLKNFHFDRARGEVLSHFDRLNSIKAQFDSLTRTPEVKSLKNSEALLEQVQKLVTEQNQLYKRFRLAQRSSSAPSESLEYYVTTMNEVYSEIDALEKKLQILANKALRKIEKLLSLFHSLREIDQNWSDHRSSLNRDDAAFCLAAAKLPDTYQQYLKEMTRRNDFVLNTKHEIDKFKDVVEEFRSDENRRRDEFLDRMARIQPLVADILNSRVLPEIKESVPEIYFECHYDEYIPQEFVLQQRRLSTHLHRHIESDDENDATNEHIEYLEERLQEMKEKLRTQEETKQQLIQSLESSTQSAEEKYKSENQALRDQLSNTVNELSLLKSSHESELEKSQLQLEECTEKLHNFEMEKLELTQSAMKQVDTAFEDFAKDTQRIHNEYKVQIDQLRTELQKSKQQQKLHIAHIANLEHELKESQQAQREGKSQRALEEESSTESSTAGDASSGQQHRSVPPSEEIQALLMEKDELIDSLRSQLESDRNLSESRLDQSMITCQSVEDERNDLQKENAKLKEKLQKARLMQEKSNNTIQKLCAAIDELKSEQ